MNADIVRLLREISHLRGSKSNAGIAFENAARAVEELDYNLRTCGKDIHALTIRGVGPETKRIISEYIRTGTFTGADELRAKAVIRDSLTRIIGVGDVTAEEWMRAGILSIADLKRARDNGTVSLTKAQALGLRYYDDLNTRIPRSEITEIEAVVRGAFVKLTGDRRTHVCVVGSYRRGATSSGDIDILVYRDIFRPRLLSDYVAALPNQDLVITPRGQERISYLYRHSEKMRQIDILMVRKSQSAAALLYFTGSWNFNSAMRAVAKRKGFRLNQHGLFRIRNGRVCATPIVTPTEKSIFDALSLEYHEPYERNEPPKGWFA